MKQVFKVFILDVDGVMTTGQFLYSEAGKQMKIFGMNFLLKLVKLTFCLMMVDMEMISKLLL